MIYEIAVLPVKTGQIDSFTQVFDGVSHLLAGAAGYEGHQLLQGVETPSQFNLIVQWQTLEDHKQFEASNDHDVFMAGLQAYFADEPLVYHLQKAVAAEGAASSEEKSRWTSVRRVQAQSSRSARQ